MKSEPGINCFIEDGPVDLTIFLMVAGKDSLAVTHRIFSILIPFLTLPLL